MRVLHFCDDHLIPIPETMLDLCDSKQNLFMYTCQHEFRPGGMFLELWLMLVMAI
jgi:hypothetical protein